MPFASLRQNRWAWATRQKFRRRWADETNYAGLPERAAKASPPPPPPGETAAAPGAGAAPGKKMTPAERARHASLVRWGKESPFAQRLKAVRAKRKAGGKGKAPAAPKPDKAAEKEAQRQKNLAAASEALMSADAPIGKVGLDALGTFAAGETLDPGMAKELAALGVVTVGADGTPRLNSAGRALLRAAEKGDARAVVDAAFAAGEKVGVGAAGETLPGWEQGPDGTRTKVKAPKTEPRAAASGEAAAATEEKPKGGGGGGGGGGDKPTPEEKKQQQAEARAQTARDTAAAVGLAPEDADALRDAAEGAGGGSDALRGLGLVGDDGLTTDQGRRALAALERGDQRGYQAALQDVRAKAERDAATQQRNADAATQRAAREAERAKVAAEAEAARQAQERQDVTDLLDDWEAGRTGLSYRDQRRAVRMGLARYDDAGNIRRVKPEKEATRRETKAEDSYAPPESARNNARRGLELRRKWGRGGTAVGVARARDLANGRRLPYATVARMASFNRHRQYALDGRKEPDGGPSAAYIAWLLWGGTSGVDWARGITGAAKADGIPPDRSALELEIDLLELEMTI